MGLFRHGQAIRGEKRSAEYGVWSSMRSRCLGKKRDHARYAGRGIRVCERWQSFENFLADMGPRPSLKHQIERKDNDGDYEPGNCIWATQTQQNRNRGNNRIVEFRGESLPLAAWVERLGLSYDTVKRRLLLGWSAERALTAPVRHVRRWRA